MKALAFLFLIFSATGSWAQYYVNACKTRQLDGEICIIKNIKKSDRFNSADLFALKDYVSSHPALPWMQVLDPDKKLLKKFQAAAGKIRKEDRARYNELLSRLKARMEPEQAVEAAALFVKSQPNYSFHLNSRNKLLMRRFVNVLSAGSSDKMEISDFNYRHCAPNLKKFNAIMKERGRCSNLEDSKNSFNLYHSLAELAACDAYAVQNIGVKESRLTEDSQEESSCVVRLSHISASVGRGTVEIKTGGKTFHLDWNAGHDLSGLKNDIRFWRDQLEPQFIKALDKLPVANTSNSAAED